MLPTNGRLIAVDWGDVRIGLALSDESQILASPLETLVRRAGKRFPMPRFLELVAEHRPVGVVVGLPLTGEGTEAASAAAAREMGDTIARRSGLPVELWDERFTSALAEQSLREEGGSSSRRKGGGRERARAHTGPEKARVDQRAALLLLQSWLDAHPARREGGGAA